MSAFHEPIQTPKLAALLVGAAAVLAVLAWRAGTLGSFRMPASAPAVAIVAVVVTMLLATLLGDHVGRSLYGEYARGGGLLAYVAAAMLFVTALVAFDPASLKILAWAFVAASAVVLLYGVAQVLGAEPISLTAEVGGVTSTLGQPNFVAGYVGIALAFAGWLVLDRSDPTTANWRLAGGVLLAAAAILVAVDARSFQVLLSGGGALATLAVVSAFGRLPARAILLGGGALVVATAAIALVFSAQVESQIRGGLDERLLFWEAAGDMVADSPVVGHGPSGFASLFAERRPEAHAVRFGAQQIADAPHNVPLGMLVSGGVLLLGAYLAFVGLVGARLVGAVRLAGQHERPLVAAFGAAWVAYQLQSLVSIDVPTFIVTHLLAAAAIIILSGKNATRVVALPGGLPRRGQATGFGNVVRATGVVVAFVLAWQALRPVRAELAYQDAQERLASASKLAPEAADPIRLAAAERLEDATDLAPWNGLYWAQLASAHVAIGETDAALEAGVRAANEAPSTVTYALAAAQLAERVGEADIAERYYERALDHGRNVPTVLAAYARHLVAREHIDEAVSFAARAVELSELVGPVPQDLLLLLADTLHAAGRRDEAYERYEHALTAYPDDAGLRDRIAQVHLDDRDPGRAVELLEEAVQLLDLQVYRLHLGQALEAADRIDEAIAAYELTIEMHAGQPAALAAEARLQALGAR